jgi:Acid Phosphatase
MKAKFSWIGADPCVSLALCFYVHSSCFTIPFHGYSFLTYWIVRMFFVYGRNFALTEINRLNQEGHDIRAAVASKTDEPDWARICMNHLVIDDARTTTIADCFEHSLIEISYGSKAGHIERLHRKTGIPYEQMAFFDNEDWNIKDVSRALPAVKCFYTPNGMTRQAWEKARAMFGMMETTSTDKECNNNIGSSGGGGGGGDDNVKRGSKTSSKSRKNSRK